MVSKSEREERRRERLRGAANREIKHKDGFSIVLPGEGQVPLEQRQSGRLRKTSQPGLLPLQSTRKTPVHRGNVPPTSTKQPSTAHLLPPQSSSRRTPVPKTLVPERSTKRKRPAADDVFEIPKSPAAMRGQSVPQSLDPQSQNGGRLADTQDEEKRDSHANTSKPRKKRKSIGQQSGRKKTPKTVEAASFSGDVGSRKRKRRNMGESAEPGQEDGGDSKVISLGLGNAEAMDYSSLSRASPEDDVDDQRGRPRFRKLVSRDHEGRKHSNLFLQKRPSSPNSVIAPGNLSPKTGSDGISQNTQLSHGQAIDRPEMPEQQKSAKSTKSVPRINPQAWLAPVGEAQMDRPRQARKRKKRKSIGQQVKRGAARVGSAKQTALKSRGVEGQGTDEDDQSKDVTIHQEEPGLPTASTETSSKRIKRRKRTSIGQKKSRKPSAAEYETTRQSPQKATTAVRSTKVSQDPASKVVTQSRFDKNFTHGIPITMYRPEPSPAASSASSQSDGNDPLLAPLPPAPKIINAVDVLAQVSRELVEKAASSTRLSHRGQTVVEQYGAELDERLKLLGHALGNNIGLSKRLRRITGEERKMKKDIKELKAERARIKNRREELKKVQARNRIASLIEGIQTAVKRGWEIEKGLAP